MKLFFVTNNINQTGGIERVICNLSNEFQEVNDYMVNIISIHSTDLKSIYDFNSQIDIYHLNCRVLHYQNKLQRMKQTIIYKNELFAKLNQIISDNVDIVITCHPDIGMIMSDFRKKNKLSYKLIMTDHTHYQFYSDLRKLINFCTYKKADKLIVLNNENKLFYKKKIKSVQSISNGIAKFETSPVNYANKIIISVGRLEEVKGYDLLIDSFALISEKYPDWKIYLFGEGTQRRYIEEKIIDLNLTNQIILKGVTDNVYEAMNKGSFFVFPSRLEGFGLVLLEAMQSGLGCISFKGAWSKEIIIDNYNGLIVDYLNIVEFSRAMEIMMKNESFREDMGNNAKKSIEKFYIQNVINEWKKMFISI